MNERERERLQAQETTMYYMQPHPPTVSKIFSQAKMHKFQFFVHHHLFRKIPQPMYSFSHSLLSDCDVVITIKHIFKLEYSYQEY